MKKILFLAAATSVALVGCVNDEAMEMSQVAKKVSFDTPVLGTQTRIAGEITGSDYNTQESFNAFAWQYEGTTLDMTTSFWTGTVKWSFTSDKKWATTGNGKDYYWPKGDWKLAFAAYSPSDISATVTCTEHTTSGLTITNFQVNDNVAQQQDLMYGFIDGCTEAEHGTSGVPMEFKHALSSIVFAAMDSDNSADYQIKSITVTGDFENQGTFTELATPTWSNKTKEENKSYTPAVINQEKLTATAAEITNGTSALLMIPQTVDTDATVTIEYTVIPTNSAQYDNKTTCKLSDFLQGGQAGASITTWEQGNRYTYIINFGEPKKIFFAPTVTNWVSVTGASITI